MMINRFLGELLVLRNRDEPGADHMAMLRVTRAQLLGDRSAWVRFIRFELQRGLIALWVERLANSRHLLNTGRSKCREELIECQVYSCTKGLETSIGAGGIDGPLEVVDHRQQRQDEFFRRSIGDPLDFLALAPFQVLEFGGSAKCGFLGLPDTGLRGRR